MKIIKKHYEVMKKSIDELDRETIKNHAEEVKKSGKYVDFNKRMRWDICWMAKLNQFICNELYIYVTDEHIDTALKNIVKELNILY